MVAKDSSCVIDVLESDKCLKNMCFDIKIVDYHSQRLLQRLLPLQLHLFPWIENRSATSDMNRLFFLPQDHFLLWEILNAVHFVDARKAAAPSRKFQSGDGEIGSNLQQRAPVTGTIISSSLCLIWKKRRKGIFKCSTLLMVSHLYYQLWELIL